MELLKHGRILALLSLPLILTACVSTSDHKALQAQVRVHSFAASIFWKNRQAEKSGLMGN